MILNRKATDNTSIARIIMPVLFLLVISSAGCRVSYSFTGASISNGMKTFSVAYFQNRAQLVQPGLSQYITNELIDKCKAQTPLKYTTSIGDGSFEGEIVDYNTRPTTVAADAQAAMNRFTISVKVKYTNALDPDFSFEKTFTRYEDYNSSLDLGTVETNLSQKIVSLIVEDIFNSAFVNW
jgi:hypothetical protein